MDLEVYFNDGTKALFKGVGELTISAGSVLILGKDKKLMANVLLNGVKFYAYVGSFSYGNGE